MLSIIIPLKNEYDSLLKIESKFTKENVFDFKYEVILVNDFSTDDTFLKAKEISNRNKQFLIINNLKKGLGGAINIGIEKSKGNFIFIMMADFSDSIEDLKSEIYNVEKENMLIQREQAKITEKVDVTPEEVRLYFNGLKDKGELPEIPAEVEIAQIVLKAIPSKEEDDRIIEKLNEIKTQIEEGANFKMKAIINSDDPGVTSNGGQYEVTKDSPFIKEFKETAFSLDVGQVSKPFKSDYGYHIMQLHEIRGNKRVASHILMRPSVPDQLIKDT